MSLPNMSQVSESSTKNCVFNLLSQPLVFVASNGKAAHMVKIGSKRRRTAKQIEEDNEQQ